MAQPQGIFFIVPRDRPGYAISVPKGSFERDQELAEEPFTGGKKQMWIISDGVIQNAKSGLVWAKYHCSLFQKIFRPTEVEQRFSYRN
jgi:hypothetical protein